MEHSNNKITEARSLCVKPQWHSANSVKVLLVLCLISFVPISFAKTEQEFNAEQLRLEKVIETTRPDVIWVNAEDYAKELK